MARKQWPSTLLSVRMSTEYSPCTKDSAYEQPGRFCSPGPDPNVPHRHGCVCSLLCAGRSPGPTRSGLGWGIGFSVSMSSHSGVPGIFDWSLGIKGEAKECRRDLEKLFKDSSLTRTAFSPSWPLFAWAGAGAGREHSPRYWVTAASYWSLCASQGGEES